jgi:hypothetical protein
MLELAVGGLSTSKLGRKLISYRKRGFQMAHLMRLIVFENLKRLLLIHILWSLFFSLNSIWSYGTSNYFSGF